MEGEWLPATPNAAKTTSQPSSDSIIAFKI